MWTFSSYAFLLNQADMLKLRFFYSFAADVANAEIYLNYIQMLSQEFTFVTCEINLTTDRRILMFPKFCFKSSIPIMTDK